MIESQANQGRAKQLVIISGAGSGIGLAVALHLADIGYTVLAGVRKEADGDAIVGKSSAPDRLRPIVFDVTSDDQVGAAVESVKTLVSQGYSLRAVFSNAGIGGPAGDTSCEGTPISTLSKLMDVNYLGAARFVQAFLPLVRASAGTVIINSAMMAHTVLPFNAGYAPSKSALETWADSLRREIKPYSVRVVIVELGGIATDLEAHAGHGVGAYSDLYPGAKVVGDEVANLSAHANDPNFSPQRVAELVEKILDTANPKTRYIAGGGARRLQILGFMPERLQDLVFAKLLAPKSAKKS